MTIITNPSLTETDLAQRWCLSIKTLQDWRRKGTGPAYLKLSKAVRYPLEIIEKYEAERMTNAGGSHAAN